MQLQKPFFSFVFLANFCDCAKDSEKCVVCKQGLMTAKLKTSRLVENYIEVLATDVNPRVLVQWSLICAAYQRALIKYTETFSPSQAR